MLSEFLDITRPAGAPWEVRHYTMNHIKTTTGPPIACKLQRLAPNKLPIAQKELQEMLRVATRRQSDSCWASAFHLVPKKDFLVGICLWGGGMCILNVGFCFVASVISGFIVWFWNKCAGGL
ncbi:hypothetical protein J437_LFUL000698 [Ladona fulva]|uniref:Uncharacterized protein n=1 Tax=Ladona fulva TaxID=123851 RepID=A0A8K0NZX8_LADFU|nr:hypothetical protein J437_LFUL000698 [Ladona fulva]